MQIINLDNKEQLNNFVSSQKHSQFLQAWQWGEFHKIVSNNVFRLGVHKEGELMAVATIIKKVLPMGKFYFYCPRGPIVNQSQLDHLEQILDILFIRVRALAQEQNAMFLRFDPIFALPELNFVIEQTIDVQPSQTLVLNLKKEEEDLLKAMHQKTRYNIRLAEKKGVKICEAGEEHFDEFWQLLSETSDRDKFRTHGINYYQEMLKLGHRNGGAGKDFVKLYIAQYRKKMIAANIVSFFGDTVTYMHGASARDERNVMAPYLLQRHTIQQAKESGFKYYDLYGIDEEKWPGVTKFKKGFSGKTINYPGTFDFIFDQNWYNVYKMVRKVRRTF